MTELQLYKFLEKRNIETRWDETILSCWISFYNLKEFYDMLNIRDGEDSINVQLVTDGCIYLDLANVCDRFDIDPLNICEKNEKE